MEEEGQTPQSSEKHQEHPFAGMKEGTTFEGRDVKGSKIPLEKRVLFVVLGLAALLILAYGVRWSYHYFKRITISNARVRGDIVILKATVQGKIAAFTVRDGDRVEKGQIVTQLRDENYQAELGIAEAKSRSAGLELEKAESDLANMRETTGNEVAAALSALEDSKLRLKAAAYRLRRILREKEGRYVVYSTKPIGRNVVRRPETPLQRAQARVDAAKREVWDKEGTLEAAKAKGSRMDTAQHRVDSLKVKADETRATLALARENLAATSLTAPISGILTDKRAVEGEVVKPDEGIAVIVDTDHLWVEANLEETRLGDVCLGQSVDLRVDAYPSARMSGKIVGIGPAAASELPPSSGESGTKDPLKRPPGIPLRIEVVEPSVHLMAGMGAAVEIDVRHGR